MEINMMLYLNRYMETQILLHLVHTLPPNGRGWFSLTLQESLSVVQVGRLVQLGGRQCPSYPVLHTISTCPEGEGGVVNETIPLGC